MGICNVLVNIFHLPIYDHWYYKKQNIIILQNNINILWGLVSLNYPNYLINSL